MENGIATKKVKLENSSVFGQVPMYPPDPVFHINDSFNSDKDPRSVNLSVGGKLQLPVLYAPNLKVKQSQ